jgi:signal transduction histidine kinase
MRLIDISAYRIVQEEITNVLKHSRADVVHLRIDVTKSCLPVTVCGPGPSRANGCPSTTIAARVT